VTVFCLKMLVKNDVDSYRKGAKVITVARQSAAKKNEKKKKTVDSDKKCDRLLEQFKKRRLETPSVEPPPVSWETNNKVKSGKIN